MRGRAERLEAAPARAEDGIRSHYRYRGRFDAMELIAIVFNRAPAVVVVLEGETSRRLPLVGGGLVLRTGIPGAGDAPIEP